MKKMNVPSGSLRKPYNFNHDLAKNFNLKTNGNIFTQVCKNANLQSSDAFVSKALQIYEALQLYKGVVLIGEPMSGKTSALEVWSI